jgi:hypothetical protein
LAGAAHTLVECSCGYIGMRHFSVFMFRLPSRASQLAISSVTELSAWLQLGSFCQKRIGA